MLYHNYGNWSKNNLIMTQTELGRAGRNCNDQLFAFYDLRPVFMGMPLYFVMRSASRDNSMRWYFKLFTIQ